MSQKTGIIEVEFSFAEPAKARGQALFGRFSNSTIIQAALQANRRSGELSEAKCRLAIRLSILAV